MNDLTLGLRIRVNDDGSVQVLNRTGEGINRISNASGNASRNLKVMDSAAAGVMRTLAPLVGIYELISFGDRVVNDTATVQDLDTRLHSLTQTAGDYAKTVGYINTVAEEQHKKLNDLTDSYAKLRVLENNGIISGQQTKGLYEGMNNAASALGASNDQLKQSVYGLSQGLASGVLHAEELNQVVEPMPGLMNSLDNALGKGAGGFRRLTNDGKITSQMFAVTLVKALHDYDGAAAATAQNINAKSTDISNSWTRLVKSVEPTTSALWTPIQDGAKEALDSIREFNEAAITVGDTNVSASNLAKGAWEVTTQVISGGWATLKEAGLGAATDTVSGWIVSGDQMKSNVKFVVNDMIGLFVGLGHSVGIIAATVATNFNNMIDNVIARTSAAAGDVARMGVGDFSFSSSKAVVAKPMVNGWDDIVSQLKTDMSTDYVGTFTKAVEGEAVAYQNFSNEQKKAADAAEQATAKTLQAAAAHNSHGNAVGQSAEATKKAASEAKKHADAINKEIAGLNDQHQKLTLSERAYQQAKLAAMGMQGAVLNSAMAQWDANKALEKQTDVSDKAKSAMESLIDKYNQLTLSARDYYLTTLKDKDGKALSPELTAPLAQQFDKNAVLEANKQLIDDATASVNKYASSIDSAKNNMADLGGVTSSVFDGALGGVSLLSGAIDNMVTALEKNASALDQLGMDRLDNDEKQRAGLKALADMRVKGQISESEAIIARGKINVKWSENELGLTKSEIALSKEKTGTELSGARQIAGAAARMFDEKSSAAKALHALEMGIAVAQMAMQVKSMAVSALATGKSIIAGAAKFFEQSGWLGFAGVAAMGAVMAGLGYGMADTGGGGGASAPLPLSPDTGTVLGDPTAKSESIDKTYQLLKDIHADEYAELRGINQGIASLKGGITDVITRLYQAGGLSAVGVLPTTKSLAINPMMFNVLAGGWIGLLAEGLKKLPVIGGFLSGIEDFVLGGLFGKKTVSQQVTGQGIQTNPTSILDIINGGNLSASQFADIATTVKKKSWFSSSSSTTYSTQYAALDAATQEALNKVFGSMGHTMLSLADSIGHDTKRSVENYIIPAMKVDLKGLSGEDAAKRLNGVISAELDNMATTVFGDIIGQYQQLGEGMLETAVRIVAEVAVVEDALSKSGLSISGDAIAISDGLAQAAGGLQEFQKQFDNYYQKFYTDAERHAFTQRQLNSQLSDVNVLLPATRDGYRKIIEALDINNAADQQRYSMLLKLSDAADSYYQTIESQAEDAQRIAQQRRALDIEYMTLSSRALGALIERRKDELAALDPSLRFKQQAVWAASEANKAIDDAMATLKKSVADQKALNASAHQAKIDALTIERQTALEGMTIQKQAATDLLNSLKTVAANIKTALGSTVIDSQAYMRKRREDAQDVLSAALLSAQAGGSLADFKGLDQALADIAKPSEQLHATFVDYAIDQARTGAVISSLDEHATAQISVADQTLAAIEANTKQVSASIEASTKELRATLEADNAALDALITTAQAQIDAARGTTAEVMSVKDAVDNLARALEVRSQTLKAIESANAATAFADAAKKIADDANSKAQSSADALAAQIALSERATKAAADAQRDATAKATWQPAPNTWIAGQSGNPLWEKVLAAFNAEHTAKYGIAMNRPWSSDAPSQHQYRYLVGEYNSLASAAASAAQASASALAATADAIKTAIPDYQAAADTDARAASTANADAAAKAAAAGAAQSAAVEFEYTSQGGAAINKIADKFYNAFNGLTVSASTKKDNFEALRRASGFGAVYELATKQGLDSRGLDLLMDWSAGTSAQKAENWKLPAFDVGINNVPFDMAAIVHQGERIFPAADNRELMMRLSEPRQSGVQVDALVAEVQELRRVAAELQVALNKIEKNTGGTESSSKRMADQLRSMTPDGQSLRVTTA